MRVVRWICLPGILCPLIQPPPLLSPFYRLIDWSSCLWVGSTSSASLSVLVVTWCVGLVPSCRSWLCVCLTVSLLCRLVVRAWLCR